MVHEVIGTVPIHEKAYLRNPQQKEINTEISTLNTNDSQEATPSKHRMMIDQNPEPQDEEDMKDTIPEGMDSSWSRRCMH